MREDEVVAWGDLAGEVVARGAGHVQDVHRGIADRLLDAVDRVAPGAGTPSRLLHDGIVTTTYHAVRHGGRVAARLGGRLAGWAWPRDASPGVRSPVGATAQATVVGLIGDRLADAGSPVAWPVRLRADDRDVAVAPRPLAEAYPEATGRVVLFLHGLFESEHAWRFRARRWWSEDDATLGNRLAADGWTAVHVRYPSSQPLVDNGRELAELVRRVVDVWPTPVEEVAFVGHSMGGLVARHAVHVAHTEGHDWLARCRHLVCLGTPHGGSPVARAAASAAQALGRRPETRGIGDIVELRSPGIRDLEVTDPIPDVLGVDVHVVAAVLSPGTDRISTDVVGDLLVTAPSGRGRAADGSWVRAATNRTFWGMHHFDLLNHPDVDAHVRSLLADGHDGGVAMSTISGRTTET